MRSKFVPFEFGETMTWAEIPRGHILFSTIVHHVAAARRAKKRKNPHAQAMVRARNRKLTAEQRSAIARAAVNERWRRARAKAAA